MTGAPGTGPVEGKRGTRGGWEGRALPLLFSAVSSFLSHLLFVNKTSSSCGVTRQCVVLTDVESLADCKYPAPLAPPPQGLRALLGFSCRHGPCCSGANSLFCVLIHVADGLDEVFNAVFDPQDLLAECIL